MGDIEILGIPISLGTMIYQAILFTALIFILKNKFLGKLVEAMENRRKNIESQLKLADEYKHGAEEELMKQRELTEKTIREVKETIKKAREEASNIIKEAKKDALTIRTEAYERERRATRGREVL